MDGACSMIKKELNKRLRVGLILLSAILLIADVYMLYRKIALPEVQVVKTTLYEYTNKTDIHYKVSLKPNNLFAQTTQEEGQVYLTNLVDTITATFSYAFSGKSQIDIQGDYEIIAVLEGSSLQNNKRVSIWKKQVVLVPKTSFEKKDTQFNLTKDVNLNLKQYKAFANAIKEEAKVDADVSLTAAMNVNLDSMTEYGRIQDQVASSISLPLKTSYFEITNIGIGDQPGAIENVKQVPVDQKFSVIGLALLGFILLAGLVCLILLTKEIPEDPYLKKLKMIMKQFSNRMVALDSDIIERGDKYQVQSVDDLVKLSDELGKPILYRTFADLKKITTFYIFDEKCIYYFDLT
jgi:hypothetical protein